MSLYKLKTKKVTSRKSMWFHQKRFQKALISLWLKEKGDQNMFRELMRLVPKTGATCEADLLKAPLEGQHGSVSSCCSTFGFSVSTQWRLGKRLQDTRSQDACRGEIRF